MCQLSDVVILEKTKLLAYQEQTETKKKQNWVSESLWYECRSVLVQVALPNNQINV